MDGELRNIFYEFAEVWAYSSAEMNVLLYDIRGITFLLLLCACGGKFSECRNRMYSELIVLL